MAWLVTSVVFRNRPALLTQESMQDVANAAEPRKEDESRLLMYAEVNRRALSQNPP